MKSSLPPPLSTSILFGWDIVWLRIYVDEVGSTTLPGCTSTWARWTVGLIDFQLFPKSSLGTRGKICLPMWMKVSQNIIDLGWDLHEVHYLQTFQFHHWKGHIMHRGLLITKTLWRLVLLLFDGFRHKIKYRISCHTSKFDIKRNWVQVSKFLKKFSQIKNCHWKFKLAVMKLVLRLSWSSSVEKWI